MEDLEIAILIVVLLLLLLSVVSIVLFWKESGNTGYDYRRLLHPANCTCSSCVIKSEGFVGGGEEYESFEPAKNVEKEDKWQNEIQRIHFKMYIDKRWFFWVFSSARRRD